MKYLSHKKYLEEEAKHHDETAAYYTERREKDYIWEIPEELLLFNKVEFTTNEVVIDMGCGPCVSIKNIIPQHILNKVNFIGVDISEELLKYAKKYIPNGNFIRDDIETVKFNNDFADKIISLGALHHAENKTNTLKNWFKTLKSGGLILMREPTYEALKRGTGESPMEEGVKIDEVMKFIRDNDLRLVNLSYFSSPAFHFFNRVMIKLGLRKWQEIKTLWYPVVYLDAFGCKVLSRFTPLFKGEAFVMILQKQ